MLEVTLRTPCALEAIAEMAKVEGGVVGEPEAGPEAREVRVGDVLGGGGPGSGLAEGERVGEHGELRRETQASGRRQSLNGVD